MPGNPDKVPRPNADAYEPDAAEGSTAMRESFGEKGNANT